MKKFKALVFFAFVLCFITKTSAQKSIGINLNRNFSGGKEARKNILSNTGLGVSFLVKDTTKRHINYEVSCGVDFNNITIIDQFYYPPFIVDYNKIYTHTISNVNIDATISLKKKFIIKNNFPYFGLGITPKVFVISRAKVFYNDSLLVNTSGIRLNGVNDFLKVYDLFYLGVELQKKIDIRIRSEGLILKKIGLNDIYYFKSEGVINYSQISVQIILNL